MRADGLQGEGVAATKPGGALARNQPTMPGRVSQGEGFTHALPGPRGDRLRPAHPTGPDHWSVVLEVERPAHHPAPTRPGPAPSPTTVVVTVQDVAAKPAGGWDGVADGRGPSHRVGRLEISKHETHKTHPRWLHGSFRGNDLYTERRKAVGGMSPPDDLYTTCIQIPTARV